jgi:hypothetical protein
MCTLWQVEQNSAVRCSGFRNVALWKAGLALMSCWLTARSAGLVLNANG